MTDPMHFTVDQLAALVPDGASLSVHKGDEPDVPMAGCERWRVVIRNDGSGGRREVWRGERWVDTKWDHGLTPKK